MVEKLIKVNKTKMDSKKYISVYCGESKRAGYQKIM